jgi:cation transport protein ChaC
LRYRPEPGGARTEPDGGAWVFAYGSLIWNPAIHYVERRFARVHGWHRTFCLSTIAGRGSPDVPGLVLGLDRGGCCTGAAFRIAEECLEEELRLLWRREMLSGSYRPRWVPVRDEAGTVYGHAIAFTIRRGGTYYVGGLAEDEVVRRLAKARGALGSSAEYLFQTRDGLRSLGIVDRRIERLAEQVEALVRSGAAGSGALGS